MKYKILVFLVLLGLSVSFLSCSENSAKKGDLKKEMVIDKQYLNVPLLFGPSDRYMTIKVDDILLGKFHLPLAPDVEDYYGFLDLSQHQGKTLTVEVDSIYSGLQKISLNDGIKGSDSLYMEQYRPQLHFSSKRGWLNDPNGLIYYKGEYHMYYQHNPMAAHWGNMSWGHAVSKDLVHWEERPAVLYPKPDPGACFSGAAFIDHTNQLGLKTGEEDVILAFYLRTNIGLCFAYSNDGGQTMTDFEGNPVLTHEGARIDTPRPFWFEPTKRWVAPTYDFFINENGEKLRCVGIYSSENLIDWELESRVEQDSWGDELCGCVDFFQLPVDGNTAEKKWVMIFIDGSYIVGTFDGNTFYTLEGKPASTKDRIQSLVIDENYYATMTWHNMPNDRRVQVTWMRGPENPGMPFNQQLTLPSELTLHLTEEGYRLQMNPIEELKDLRTKTQQWNNLGLNKTNNPLSALNKELYELELTFIPGENSMTILDLRGVKISYDALKEEISINDIKTQLKLENGQIKLQIFVDRTSIEVYGNGGMIYLPLINMMPQNNHSYGIIAVQGNSEVKSLKVHELKSIWDANEP